MYKRFIDWYERPATGREKAWAIWGGLLGGFWWAIIFAILTFSMPVDLFLLIKVGLLGSIFALVLGKFFPKTVIVICPPFMFFG